MPPLTEVHLQILTCLDRWNRRLVQCQSVGTVPLFQGYIGITDSRGTRPPIKNDWGISLDWVPLELITAEFDWPRTGIGRACEDIIAWEYVDSKSIIVSKEFLDVAKLFSLCDLTNMLGGFSYKRMDGKIVKLVKTVGTKQELIAISVEGQFSSYLKIGVPTHASRINNRGVDRLYAESASRRGDRHGTPALSEPVQTADEACRRLGKEWATARELSKLFCRTETSIRSAVNRHIRKLAGIEKGAFRELNLRSIPNPGPHMPEQEYRITGVWPLLFPDKA